MKKMIFSVLALLVLMAGALWAFENYHDVLAAGLFMSCLIPSVIFEEGRKEWKGE